MPAHQDADRYEIAVVGMAARVPGANSIAEYWTNLAGGVESIRTFEKSELLARGVDVGRIANPVFVPVASQIEDYDRFAAEFFGYSPREATLMDPQHRIFLECCWEAIEHAGYAPRHLPSQTGVFAGTSLSSYMLFNLLGNPSVHEEDAFQVMIGGDKDFLSTRVAYKLNLKGPALAIQTGCSSSLVAVHLATQSLLTYQCDVALAGGVSVGVPQKTGYEYEADGLKSPDGHCRAFDAGAGGTVFGDGLGVVVLKRLEDAIRDGDTIHALILGSAINNDGAAKIGYTAPSIDGQSELIAAAHAVAGISAETVSYVEAHGTATALGDPAEVAALTQAFRRSTDRRRFCAIGSVKTNIGHLDAAAGVAGLIKTVLMLENKTLVPSLHFETPNPAIDFENSPFYVETCTRPWHSKTARRAGVSSFGIGGTNAHVVLEEAPALTTTPSPRPCQILSVSALTPAALEHAANQLSAFLADFPNVPLADIAYTLHVGREAFAYRRSVVCTDHSTGAESLLGRNAQLCSAAETAEVARAGFLFPGVGTQSPGMGEEIYRSEPQFRKEVDRCSDLLIEVLGYDLRHILYPPSARAPEAATALARPSAGMPAIFVTEYALAKLLISWGIRPAMLFGHSLGEYTAACLAHVFSLEDALSLVAFRGRLFESLPEGSMLSVCVSEEEGRRIADGKASVAAVNAPDQCVLSGASGAIDRVAEDLTARGIDFHRLRVAGAMHSSMIESVLPRFRSFLSGIRLGEPSLPFISNLTGTWIRTEEARDPEYWVRHLRETVRFSDGLATVLATGNPVLLEVGPSRSLTSLVKARARSKPVVVNSCMRHPQQKETDLKCLYTAVARSWDAGLAFDWKGFYSSENRRRVPLPTYPFERSRYWLDPAPSPATRQRGGDARQMGSVHVSVPVWERSELTVQTRDTAAAKKHWVILADDLGVAERLAAIVQMRGEQATLVRAQARYRTGEIGERATSFINPGSAHDLEMLLREAPNSDELLVVHLSGLTQSIEPQPQFSPRVEAGERGLTSILALVNAARSCSGRRAAKLLVVSNGLFQVGGADSTCPEKALIAGACRGLAWEWPEGECRIVDVLLSEPLQPALSRIAAQIAMEGSTEWTRDWVAYRGNQRWRQALRTVSPEASECGGSTLKNGGVYLITGGLGRLGPLIAAHIAGQVNCTVVVTTRSDAHWAPQSNPQHAALLNSTKAQGSRIEVFSADVADESQMRRLVDAIYDQFGVLNGVIHLAGVTGEDSLRLLPDLDTQELERQFHARVGGCNTLLSVLRDRHIDFCVLFSSTASLLGGTGLTAYAAGAAFLDAFAVAAALETGQRWLSISWDPWRLEQNGTSAHAGHAGLDRFALAVEDALRSMIQILDSDVTGHVIVSSGDIFSRLNEGPFAATVTARQNPVNLPDQVHPRPLLHSDYVAPRNELQRRIAEIWAEVLGLERVGIEDNLFELGGNSLIGLKIVAGVKTKLGFELPVTVLFEAPTVGALAAMLEQPDPSEGAAFESSRKRGELRRTRHAAVAGS